MQKIITSLLCVVALGICVEKKIQISDLERTMLRSKIIPEILSVPPMLLLRVVYPVSEVTLGNHIKPFLAKFPPNVSWIGADPDSYYTLCMIDPDSPNRKRPIDRSWHHWLVGNIPGQDVASGDTLSEYIGAAPGQTTGFHRFILLVYKQPSKIKFNEPILSNKSYIKRRNFNVTNFAKKYNFGTPLAGNFFLAKYDMLSSNWTSDYNARPNSSSPIQNSSSVSQDQIDIPTVSYEQMREIIKQNKTLIIDVRSKRELFETGVIPNSYNIPIDDFVHAFILTPDDFLKTYYFPKPDKDSKIVFYCAKGIRSLHACYYLLFLGYKNVFNYVEGWYGWTKH